jgi:phosphoglycerate dehydrogenase-like enzyme
VAEDSQLWVMIASPLEAEHVARIRESVPGSVQILYAPELLPPTRYVGDHGGVAGFELDPEQRERWYAMLAGADVLFDFPWNDRRHPHAYAPRARWVQTTSAGVGQAVVRMGIRHGELLVTTSSGVHARPLAEFVFLVLLMAAKEYRRIVDDQAARRWERFCSDELSGKLLAIVGAGKIGREIARIARVFDMVPVGIARDYRPERAPELGLDRLYPRDELRAMLGAADAVVLCAPHTPETENIIGAEELATLKPGVTFINIGRGQLVDEDALIAKLRDGTIGFAGLDVFRSEPLSPDSPLWDFPNVIINPHSASTSDRENGRITDIFIHNLHAFLEGRQAEMRNVLNIERMY